LLGFFFAADREQASVLGRLRWKRAILALGLMLVAGYVTCAVGLYFVARVAFHSENVRFADLAMPTRWHRYRAARGDDHVAEAQRLMEKGLRREALSLARAGVAQSPANRDGRLVLARLLFEAGRADSACATLVDGLSLHASHDDYLRALFTALLREQRDAQVAGLARDLLAGRDVPLPRQHLLALAGATARYFRGEFDQADDFLERPAGLADSRDGRVLATKIDWARGYRELALLSLRTLAREFPHDAEVRSELVHRLLDLGLHDEARRETLAFQIAHPALAGPRIDLLRFFRANPDPSRAAREADILLEEFAADPAALAAVGEFAAKAGDSALARRLLDLARARAQPWELHALLLIEALVVQRDFRGALATADDLARREPNFAAAQQARLNSLLAVAHFGLGNIDAGRLFLANFLRQSYLRADNLLAIAQRLVEVGAYEPARDALVRAVAADPLNQAALTRLVELELNLNRIDELPAHLARLVTMRQPSPDVLRVAQLKLGGDLYLFSADRPAALAAVRAALEKKTTRRPRL
jgi:thioredoxin-like negative regulator of GroEL